MDSMKDINSRFSRVMSSGETSTVAKVIAVLNKFILVISHKKTLAG